MPCSRTQCSAARESLTHNLSISSQALPLSHSAPVGFLISRYESITFSSPELNTRLLKVSFCYCWVLSSINYFKRHLNHRTESHLLLWSIVLLQSCSKLLKNSMQYSGCHGNVSENNTAQMVTCIGGSDPSLTGVLRQMIMIDCYIRKALSTGFNPLLQKKSEICPLSDIVCCIFFY